MLGLKLCATTAQLDSVIFFFFALTASGSTNYLNCACAPSVSEESDLALSLFAERGEGIHGSQPEVTHCTRSLSGPLTVSPGPGRISTRVIYQGEKD